MFTPAIRATKISMLHRDLGLGLGPYLIASFSFRAVETAKSPVGARKIAACRTVPEFPNEGRLRRFASAVNNREGREENPFAPRVSRDPGGRWHP
jgi:hypothetical protein